MSNDTQLVEDLLKEQFVEVWLRTGDPFKAAHECFPTDSGRAVRASWEWPKDLAVLQYKAELIAAGDGCPGLPSKLQMALEVYRIGASSDIAVEDRLGAYRLSAELAGYIGKGANINIDNRSLTVNNKVMVVKDHGTDDAWEQSLRKNQIGLQAANGT